MPVPVTPKETGIVRNYNRSNDSFGRTEYNLITVTGMGSYSLLRRSQYERPLTLQQAGLTWIRAGERSTLSTEVVYSHRESSFSRRGSSAAVPSLSRWAPILKTKSGRISLLPAPWAM